MTDVHRTGLRALGRPGFILLLPFLASCGGGGGDVVTPEPSGQTLVVHLSSTGESLDADGYTVRLGTRSASVGVNGTATFTDVSPGVHQVRVEGIAGNCRVEGADVRSVTVPASAGAQVSFTVSCVFDFDDGITTLACENLSLSSASGVPLGRVAVSGLPPSLQLPAGVKVMTDDRRFEALSFVEVDGGSVQMTVPVHPEAGPGGGLVQLRFTDGIRACVPIDFTILPLPAAPGELAGVVDGLQAILSQQAAFFGTTTAEIVATPFDELDRVLIPLAVVQWAVDHPQNERSLRRVAEGTAPVDVPLDVLEPLLALLGLREELEAAPSGSAAASPGPARVSLGTRTCLPETIGTTETLILSDCMNAQVEAARNLDSASGGLMQQISNLSWILEALPGSKGALAAWFSAIHWAVLNSQERLVALLPCCIAEVPVDGQPIYFMEDDPGTGAWYAYVIAINQGWDLGKEILEAALKAASAAAGMEGLDADLQVGGPQFENAAGAVLTGPVADFLLADGALDDFLIPIESFGPVPIFEPQWSRVSYSGSALDSIQHNTYEPKEAGTVTLQVSTNSEASPPQFGGQLGVGFQDIEVDSIRIEVEPADTFVGPGTTKTFRIEVKASFFPDSITVLAEQGTVGTPQGQDGVYELLYTPPADARYGNPDRIEVYHIGSTGARENGPPRMGAATVRFGKVEISPRSLCLEVLETQTFTAEVEGPDDTSVEWTADFGTIGNSSGEYRAPGTRPPGGLVKIRATSVENEALFDEVTVPIGCTCQATFRVEGRTYHAQPGDLLRFSDWGGPDEPDGHNFELVSVGISRSSENWSTRTLPLTDEPGAGPTGPGTMPVRVQGDFGLPDDSDLLYSSDDEDAPARLTIEEYIPSKLLRGRVVSEVQVISGTFPFSRMTTLDWSFTVTVPPGVGRPAFPGMFGYQFQCTVSADD